MKRWIAVCLMTSLFAQGFAGEDINEYKTETYALWRRGVGAEDEAFICNGLSMLGWGVGLAAGIGILASVLHQSSSSSFQDLRDIVIKLACSLLFFLSSASLFSTTEATAPPQLLEKSIETPEENSEAPLKKSFCYFHPPKGWEIAQSQSTSPHVKNGILSKRTKKKVLFFSINLAVEEVGIGSLSDYLNAVKAIYEQNRNNRWSKKPLGKCAHRRRRCPIDRDRYHFAAGQRPHAPTDLSKRRPSTHHHRSSIKK